jgi:hypothetical protein
LMEERLEKENGHERVHFPQMPRLYLIIHAYTSVLRATYAGKRVPTRA